VNVVEAPLTSPSGERRTAWRRLLVGLAVLVVAAFGLSALARHEPPEPRAPFDAKLVRRLARQKPDFVILGNSMVDSRFDQAELNRLLRPARVSVIGVGGTKTAHWYLTLKNIVLPTIQPKRVLLFFRRHELTGIRDKATGVFASTLDRYRQGEEPLLDAKLAPPMREPIERLGYELARFAPFSRLHALADPLVEGWARGLTGTARGNARRNSRRALADVFAVDKLRNANFEPATGPVERGGFDDTVDESFLPDIIRLCARARVPLTILRVRTLAYAEGRAHPSDYDKELARYLKKRRIDFVDLSQEDWETAAMYGEGDHIAPRYKATYTRLFVEHLRKIFR